MNSEELNAAELMGLVDRYLATRTFVLLKERGLQASEVQELDAAARAAELRDYWAATPGCTWHDGAERGEEVEDFWSVDLLLDELDSRAWDVCVHMAEVRGIELPEDVNDSD